MAKFLTKTEGNEIKKKLIDADISQAEIARRLGYAREHVVNMINGRYRASDKLLNFIEQLKAQHQPA